MNFKIKTEVRKVDWPPGCLSQRLKTGTRPCVMIGIVDPLPPGSVSRENSCFRDLGG